MLMNNILIIELIGVPAIFFGGVFFHFLYKYGGKKNWMAIISPVNESIWEHLKLAFYPTLLFTLFEFLIIKPTPTNFLTAELIGIYIMIFFILITEWIYPKIVKRNILLIDLFIFFVAILISQLSSYFIFNNLEAIKIADVAIFVIIFIQTLIFTLFSFKPPKLELFRDSVDGRYGIK